MLLDKFQQRFHSSRSGRQDISSGGGARSQEQMDSSGSSNDMMEGVTEEQEFRVQEQPRPQVLQVNTASDYDEDFDNDDDLISVDWNVSTPVTSLYNFRQPSIRASGVKTPISATTPMPLPPYLNSNQNFQNSSTSLASSFSDLPVLNTTGRQANLNPAFLNLLLDMYQCICTDPTTTPFDAANPPSGILNKVAKISIEQAGARGIDIGIDRNNALLTIVRRRLLYEIKKDNEQQHLSRTNSVSSLLPLPPHFNELAATLNAHCNNSNNNNNNSLTNDTDMYYHETRTPATLLRSRSNSSQFIMSQQSSSQQHPLSRTTSNAGSINGMIQQYLQRER